MRVFAVSSGCYAPTLRPYYEEVWYGYEYCSIDPSSSAQLAHARKRPFNEVAQYYAMERFLARLAHTRYIEQFVLKGALALRTWSFSETRATRDLDFVLLSAGGLDLALRPDKASDRERAILPVLDECLRAQMVEDDGIHFDPASIAVESIVGQTDDAGLRVTFRGVLGTVRLAMQVDISLGDAVEPPPVWLAYPQLLVEAPLRVLGYSLETIVAEKFHAIVHRDMTNSRMKDFYDIWMIWREHPPQDEPLAAAISATFQRRDTQIPREIPVGLSEAFFTAPEKVVQWMAFWRKGRFPGEIPVFREVVLPIREWLLTVCANISE